LDEIQECPDAIRYLRYFKEEMPELHVIAAGSLLEFTLEKLGVAVGRVDYLFLYRYFKSIQIYRIDTLA